MTGTQWNGRCTKVFMPAASLIWIFELRTGNGAGCRGKAHPDSKTAYGILLDIGTRRSAQITDSRLAAIVSSSDDAIVGKTIDGIVSDWNRGAEAIFGYRAEEMVGKPISVLLPPGLEGEEEVILERIRRGERIDHFETRRRRKDGAGDRCFGDDIARL